MNFPEKMFFYLTLQEARFKTFICKINLKMVLSLNTVCPSGSRGGAAHESMEFVV